MHYQSYRLCDNSWIITLQLYWTMSSEVYFFSQFLDIIIWTYFCYLYSWQHSWDRSVTTVTKATGWITQKLEFAGIWHFPFYASVQTSCRVQPSSCPMSTMSFSRGEVTEPWNGSSPSSPKMNAWSYISTLPYVIMAQCLIKHKDVTFLINAARAKPKVPPIQSSYTIRVTEVQHPFDSTLNSKCFSSRNK